MDRKADNEDAHREQLRSDRQTNLERIAGYHWHIDGCTWEMRDCERRIDQARAGVRSQQERRSCHTETGS